MRLDMLLTEKGLAKSRERAKELIKAGQVTVNGKTAAKPSLDVSEDCALQVVGGQLKYAGRGGLKLEKAVSEFGIKLAGRVCLDIGASTGGFTDCMLQCGGSFVYAVDVGHSQLDEKLLGDSRVLNMEKTNILNLAADDFPRNPDFISADVSFVSLTRILPKIAELLPGSGEAVVLIKPQFEAGRANVGKNGIVKDRKVHARVLEEICACCCSLGLEAAGLTYSPIKGGNGHDGNIEYLAYLKKGTALNIYDFAEIVNTAFESLK